MLPPDQVLASLSKNKIDFFAGVPDSLLKEFLTAVTQKVAKSAHFVCANEGNAIALAAGYHLATNKLPLVYMQNSGLGNAVNPLMSLCHQEVYSIPMVLLIGWRGEPEVSDEPQHKAMGAITTQLLNLLRIDFQELNADSDIDKIITQAAEKARASNAPVAILCRKNSFEKVNQFSGIKNELQMTRADAVEQILATAVSETALVCNTGFTGREVFGQRKKSKQIHSRDFLNAGAMGHVSQIALGIATGNASAKVICLDGDGSLIMHLGALAIIGPRAPSNLTHILLNNGVHDSVGAQPTAGFNIDIQAIARACGYPKVDICESIEELKELLPQHLGSDSLSFLEIKIRPGSSDELPRPPQDFSDQKIEFMKTLSSSGK